MFQQRERVPTEDMLQQRGHVPNRENMLQQRGHVPTETAYLLRAEYVLSNTEDLHQINNPFTAQHHCLSVH